MPWKQDTVPRAEARPERLEAVTAALASVRGALIDEAEAQAIDLRQRAQEAADKRVSQEQEVADHAVELAVERRERSAAAAFDQAIAAERNHASGLALARRRAHRQLLIEQTTASARTMRSDPRYGELVQALTRRAVEQLGPNARLEVDGAAGGVVATLGHERVDYSLEALAARALAALADEVAEVSGR